MVSVPSLAPLWPERRGPRRLGPSSSLSAPAVSDATSPKAHRPRLLLLGTSDSLFRVSLSFHGLLKAVRLAAQPWDPPHVGISPERRSSCLLFPSGRQGSQFPVPAPPVIEPFPSRSISAALLIRCPAPELSNIVTT